MSRHRQSDTLDAPPALPIAPALDLRPDAVYLPSQIRTALGLRASSLRSEWRAGRLRIIRRCGRNYLLGRDVLAWLMAANCHRQSTSETARGQPENEATK